MWFPTCQKQPGSGIGVVSQLERSGFRIVSAYFCVGKRVGLLHSKTAAKYLQVNETHQYHLGPKEAG
jgi:hypothetical protein